MQILFVLAALLTQEPEVDALLKQLSDDSIQVREKAAASLVAIGDKAEVRIRSELGRAEPGLKVRFENILSLIEKDRRKRAVLPPLKLVSISAKDRPVRDVIDDFQRQTGLAVGLDGDVDQRVTFEVKDATPFDALVAFCRAGNLGFEPDAFRRRPDGKEDREQSNKIWLTPGAFLDVPRNTVRHYSVETLSVAIGRKWHVGTVTQSAELSLMARWLPGTAPKFVKISVHSVTDDKGRALFRAGTPVTSTWARDNYLPHPLSELHEVSLDQPSDGARSLASIKGAVTAYYAVGELKTVFESPEKWVGKTKEIDGLTVRLVSWKLEKEDECSVIVFVEGQSTSRPGERPKAPTLVARLANGLVRTLWGGCGLTDDNKYSSTGSFIKLNSPIVALEVTVETYYHEDKFEFELKNCPLP